MDIKEIFAVNLRRLRGERGLSQEELASRAKIDRTYVSALERSEYSATITMVSKLSTVLGVTPSSMLERGPKAAKPVKKKS